MRGEPEWNASVARSLTLCVKQHASLTRASLRVHQVPLSVTHGCVLHIARGSDSKDNKSTFFCALGTKTSETQQASLCLVQRRATMDRSPKSQKVPNLVYCCRRFNFMRISNAGLIRWTILRKHGSWAGHELLRCQVRQEQTLDGAPKKKNCSPQREFQMAARTLRQTKP